MSSKVYLGQEPNCKGSDPACENLDTEYENLKYKRQSLYDRFNSVFNKAKSAYYNKVDSKSDIYWSKKSDKTFIILIIVSVIYIAVGFSNIFPAPPYEETTNFSFFFGLFTLLYIIFYFCIPFTDENTTMFQKMIIWSEETINDWKIEMQKTTLNAYGKNFKVVLDGKEIQQTETDDVEEEKKSILSRIYENITSIFSVFNDTTVKKKEFSLKDLVLCRNMKTVMETYTYYTVHNIVITVLFLVVVYFTFFSDTSKGQWWFILFYPIVLSVFFYHLTYWFMFFTSSFEERDNEKITIVGTDWTKVLFWIVNITLLVICVALFITVLFQNDALASWSLFSMVGFIGILILSTIEGDTFKEKLTRFSEMHSSSFKHLISLVIYMLCFVYFYATPSTELPQLFKSSYKTLYQALGSAFVENFYSYIFFPLTIIAAFYYFIRAIFTQVTAEHGKEIDYNAIRIRYVIIYFLCFVFFCTLYFHQSKIPCYAQIFFNSAGLKSKIIFNTIIALFVFGFLFTFSILYSPQDAILKKETPKEDVSDDETKIKPAANTNIINKLDVKQIIRLLVLLIVCILVMLVFTYFYMKNRTLMTQLYNGNAQDWANTKANNENENLRNLKTFIILTPMIGIFFILYFVVTFFKKEAYANSSNNLVSTFAQIFFIFGFIGVFTCISILVVYTLIMQKQGIGINIATYVILFIMVFLIYKILVSTSVVQQNPVYKLIVELFFIIPCFFDLYVLPHILNSTMGKFALQAYKTTNFNTTIIYIILLILVLSIIAFKYVLYPLLISQNTMFGGFLLLNGPVSIYDVNSPISYNTITLLNSKYSTFSDNSGNFSNNFISSDYQNIYNYSITFWFNIANNATQENEQPLVSFGNVPVITYIADTSSLVVSFNTSTNSSNNTNILIEVPNIKLQKWTFVAINIDGGTVDIFIDNYLINSTEGIIPYVETSNSDITVGYSAMNTEVNTSSLNNTFSQVCNFVYYPHTLTITNMSDLYSQGKNMDPPINQAAETGKELTPFDQNLNELNKDFNAIKDTFECSYVDFLQPTPDACNNIIDNDDYFNNYLSLPWYFLHLGDETTGQTEASSTS